jgi:hypothetical protein
VAKQFKVICLGFCLGDLGLEHFRRPAHVRALPGHGFIFGVQRFVFGAQRGNIIVGSGPLVASGGCFVGS